MAEFKLGRIKFVWKGEWTGSTIYYVDDVVRHGGKTFICVVGHTSDSDFYTDLNNVPNRWNQFTDGQSWKGDWAASTAYKVNDIVKYGAYVYICNEGHTSNSTLELDQSKWTLFTEGFDWLGDWSVGTTYKVNDIVKYGGNVYLCNTAHTSDFSPVNGLEPDILKWDLFNEGLEWKGDWSISTRYKLNDVVKYGGYVYVCNTHHTSNSSAAVGLEADQAKWDYFNKGLEYKGDWATTTRYKLNDIVKYGAGIWICTTQHTSGSSFSTTNFTLFVQGVAFENFYSSSATYQPGDIVRYGGNSYIANLVHSNYTPTASSYTNPTIDSTTTVAGTGFDFTVNKNRTTYSVTINDGGQDYVANETFTILGTDLGGTSPDNDLVITVDTVNAGDSDAISAVSVSGDSYMPWDLFATNFYYQGTYNPATNYKIGEVITHGGYTYVAVVDNVGQDPTDTDYWSKLNSGLRWRGEWDNSIDYILGDIVRYDSFSYICIQGHTSDDDDSTITPTNNSPVKDTTGQYWNLISSGLEESVLTTTGDLVYFSTGGVTRLPIGEEGQVLAVENGVPVWKSWGESEKSFYVAPHGVDSPAPRYGLTVDKPWATVRYAAEQVEAGAFYANAAYLLKQNRTFIQKEIVEWTDKQITDGNDPFDVSFTYDKAICQRDMGLLVDAVVWDLTHGGNIRSREAALAYFTALGVSYITGQEDETIASINYGLEIIENVLNNEAPTANYQTVNGISAGDQIKQIIDFNYDAEEGVLEIISPLVRIVTDAIAAGDTDDLPAPNTPNYTINLKTGLYEEVLPIRVPANTSVVGDELRSAKVSAAGKKIATSDKAKSLATYTHLRSITGDIVTNVAVTPTSGNSETQDTTSQKGTTTGSSTAQTRVNNNVNEIIDIVQNGLGAADAYVYPNPTNWGTTLVDTAYASTGYVTGDTAGFDDGRRLLLANKAFIIDEVSSWIDAQILAGTPPFNGFVYAGIGRTKCERDVGYIVDAIVYDMTYGGNLATQIAARSYYSKGVFVETGEQAQALAVQARIKDFIDNIVIANTAGWTKTTSETQDVSGTAGSADAAAFAQDRIQEMYDTINTGTEPTTIAPYIGWVSAELTSARNALNESKAKIQSDSVQHVVKNFPTLVFDQTLCSRDVGYIVDALGYDLMFGSNFLSIQMGMSYQRGLDSTNLVITEQLAAHLSMLAFLRVYAAEIATDGGAAFADLLWQYIIGTVTAEVLPGTTGTNVPTTDLNTINGANILRLNKEFMAAEAAAWIADTYSDTVTASDTSTNKFTCSDTTWMAVGDRIEFTGTVFGNVILGTSYYVKTIDSSTEFTVSETINFDTGVVGSVFALATASGSMTISYKYDVELCKEDVRHFVDAIANDMTYTGNYHVVYASKFYINALRGSKLEDMYYVRNGCGVRNQSLYGLDGTSDGNLTGQQDALSSPNIYGSRRPNAGAYVSLDPGWGANDSRVWIIDKSTYVQNVTTFGTGCIGQKIDGAIHAQGNDSIVSNDFTQILSDGIGAWVSNLGRAELVSVFTYYNHIGYLAENGGKIRATNGNNSYGDYGSVSEGVDPTETPITGEIDNRGIEAYIQNVITNGDDVLLLEYGNAGIDYNEASYTISGAGAGAVAIGNETRDGGVFKVRLTDPGDSTGPGGNDYLTSSNVAQAGNTTSITIAATDTEISSAYIGMEILLTAGTGAGQYGIISTYNAGSKIAGIVKASDGTAGWDHVIPGTTIANSLDLTTQYTISPRVIFTDPPYSTTLRTGLASKEWSDIVYGDAYGSYTNRTVTGSVTGSSGQFDVVRRNGGYIVTNSAPGFNYVVGEVLTVAGNTVGGTTPANDITITVDVVDADSGGILEFTATGNALDQQWVAVAENSSDAYTSPDGITWTARALGTPAKWSSVAYGAVNGIGTWVTVARETNQIAYSTNGTSWTLVSLGSGEEWDWNSVAYGNGRFVAVAESDSSTARRAVSTDGGATWTLGDISSGAVAITYGNGRFVIVEGSFSNAAAYSTDGITWTASTLPANNDSSESDWRDVAFGNNRFVAIADNDAQVAVSIDAGATWIKSQLPVNADWRRIRYGNGVFFALAEGSDAASSPDGINWTQRDITATNIDILSTGKDTVDGWNAGATSSSSVWYGVGYGDMSGTDTYVMVGGTGGSPVSAFSTDNGTTWTAGTFPAGGDGPRAVAYGNGVWVASLSGSNDTATSADADTFTFQSNTLPATRDWIDIAFGNGRFVTIDGGGTTSAAYSTNGTSWTASVLPSAIAWTSVAYGTGNNWVVVSNSGTTDVAYSTDNGANWSLGAMPSSQAWSSVAYGDGKWVAVSGTAAGTTSTAAAYSTNGGATWSASTLPGAAAQWTNVVYNGSVFIATAYNSSRSAVSENGTTWTEVAMGATANWVDSASDGAYNSVTISTGSTSVRTISYEANTNRLTVDNTNILSVDDIIVVPGDSAGIEEFGGIVRDTEYFVKEIISSTEFTVSETRDGARVVLSTGSGSMYAIVKKIYSAVAYGIGEGNRGFIALADGNRNALNIYVGTTAQARAYVADDILQEIWISEPGSNYDPNNPPTMTVVDPNNTGADATYEVRVGNGVLGQPTWTNRGSNYTSASAELTGDGYADQYQTGSFINVKELTDIPVAGSNMVIDGIDDVYYKVVNVRSLLGNGPYTATIQLSPEIGNLESPEHETAINFRRRYSQVRLTGHDFLDIGTGDKADTNYPGLPNVDPNPANETVQLGGGRVFWTSTDQDGNFRVGGLFNVEQSTGTATLNAEAFNLAGLNELSLGSVALGGGGATITEFSTDPFFTLDSDSVVPTQRAIKAYINSQIGGGSGSLNVNTVTAGVIYIAGNQITTTTNETININTTVNFTGGVDGYPVALNMFLQA